MGHNCAAVVAGVDWSLDADNGEMESMLAENDSMLEQLTIGQRTQV
jgi:hypothetical protein